VTISPRPDPYSFILPGDAALSFVSFLIAQLCPLPRLESRSIPNVRTQYLGVTLSLSFSDRRSEVAARRSVTRQVVSHSTALSVCALSKVTDPCWPQVCGNPSTLRTRRGLRPSLCGASFTSERCPGVAFGGQYRPLHRHTSTAFFE
jgi:hypothetical protein